MRNVLSILDSQTQVNGNTVCLRDLPETTLETDSQKFSQVLLNIIANANEFMHNGAIRVSGAQDEFGAFTLTVEDTGCGMDKEELATAVMEFGRVSKSAFVSDGHTGTGLGLPISIGFMKLLGGKLDIESRKGEGTSVHLTLPKSAVTAIAPVQRDTTASSGGRDGAGRRHLMRFIAAVSRRAVLSGDGYCAACTAR